MVPKSIISTVLCLMFSLIGFCKTNAIRLKIKKEHEQWHSLVEKDYRKLLQHSLHQNFYGLTEDTFEELLWNGLVESIRFYESPDFIDSKQVTQWIIHKLKPNPDLNFGLPTPKTIDPCKATAFSALNNFTGIWHGNWKSERVHHHWLPVREYHKKINTESNLLGLQSCITGDGIGWNYVVEKEGNVIILGFVYHIMEDGTPVSGNPHYAFLNSNHELSWVSNNHIYYEFTGSHHHNFIGRHYIITGASYDNRSGQARLTKGFQAVYRSEERQLPKFKTLTLLPSRKEDNQTFKFLSKRIWKVLEHKITEARRMAEVLSKVRKVIPFPMLAQYLK